MSLAPQHTLAESVRLAGVGLHSGEASAVFMRRAPADHGVRFIRNDGLDVVASVRAVSGVRFGTTLADAEKRTVATVEHLMAALYFCGVDNVLVEIDGPELPILDGSAAPIVEAVERAGVIAQAAPRKRLKLLKPLEVSDGDRWIRAVPADGAYLDLAIDFDDPAIGAASVSLSLDDRAGLRARLSPARTFCRRDEIEALQSNGFARGGSLQNAIVVDGGRILNDGGLRDEQEFVLHKALDFIGDLYLLGAPFEAQLEAHRCGHDLNTRFAAAVAAAGPDVVAVVEERLRAAPRAAPCPSLPGARRAV